MMGLRTKRKVSLTDIADPGGPAHGKSLQSRFATTVKLIVAFNGMYFLAGALFIQFCALSAGCNLS